MGRATTVQFCTDLRRGSSTAESVLPTFSSPFPWAERAVCQAIGTHMGTMARSTLSLARDDGGLKA